MNPTADDIAVAICAACRETGEDPLKVASGEAPKARARHFALHALLHVFQRAPPLKVVGWVGVPINSKQFLWSSKAIASGRQVCGWWDSAVYDRVIRAIEADRTRRAVAPPAGSAGRPEPYRVGRPPDSQKRLGVLEPGGYRPPKGTTEAVLNDDGPIFDRGKWHARKPREEPANSKAQIQEELRKAAANTAAMQARDQGKPSY